MIGSVSYYFNTIELSFNYVSSVGIAIWIIGYYYQVRGDKELKNHLQNPKTRGTLLKTGLWSQTRHPNYFGEAFMWWGIFIFGLLNNVPFYYIISPLTISFVLYFISTPLLEAKMEEKEEWAEYANKTPMFFPFKLNK